MRRFAPSLFVGLALAVGGVSNAQTIDLTGLGYVTYGDAQSYSMPIANYQYGFPTNTGPFAIPSSPGQISALTVLGTGSEGQPVTTNISGMDNAYSTPSGISGSTFFSANPLTDRGVTGTVAFNSANAWDASLASLQTFLGGNQMVFFFNNNQINAGASSLQSLAAWTRIWITDGGGATVANSTFELTNNNGNYNIVSQGGGGTFLGGTGYTAPGSGAGNPDGGTGTNTDFVLAGGEICVAIFPNGTPNVPNGTPVPVPCGTSAASIGALSVSSAINHNLGADHVAYALLFPELNALLSSIFGSNPANLASYTMHVDIRLGCKAETAPADVWIDCTTYNGYGTGLNNGFEQIFIGTAKVGTCPLTDPLCNPTVPEPGSLALVAAALVSVGLIARRRQSKKASRPEE